MNIEIREETAEDHPGIRDVNRLAFEGAGEALPVDRLRAQRLVAGLPDYYPRFGFSAQLAGRLSGPFSGDGFMALQPAPGALDGVTGAGRYPEASGLTEPPVDRRPIGNQHEPGGIC